MLYFISTFENLPFIDSFFEAASAIGTVGLTVGITSDLSTPSHIMLIVMMFCGRVGCLTVFFAASSTKKVITKLPMEDITVG